MLGRTTARRRRPATLTLGATALAAALTGCGEDGPGEASEVYAAATKDLREAGSGRFTFLVEASGQELVRAEGAWESDPDRSRWTVVTNDGELTTTDRFAADTDNQWRLPDGEPENCWFVDDQSDPAQVQPGAVSAVLEARATDWDTEGTVAKATGPVFGWLQAIGDLAAEVQLPQEKTVDVDFTVMLDQGRVVAARSDIGSVLRAVRDAGGTVPERLEPFLTDQAEIPLLAGFSEQGDEVEVAPPANSQVRDCDD